MPDKPSSPPQIPPVDPRPNALTSDHTALLRQYGYGDEPSTYSYAGSGVPYAFGPGNTQVATTASESASYSVPALLSGKSVNTNVVSGDLQPAPEVIPSPPSALKPKGARGPGKGKINQLVHDRTDEYVYVTRDDLREVKTFGWLQQLLSSVGTFLFSGAFWLAATLLAEHWGESKKFVPWFVVCTVSAIAGAALFCVSLVLSWQKSKRLDKYFPKGKKAD
jgi:hypothetical protein